MRLAPVAVQPIHGMRGGKYAFDMSPSDVTGHSLDSKLGIVACYLSPADDEPFHDLNENLRQSLVDPANRARQWNLIIAPQQLVIRLPHSGMATTTYTTFAFDVSDVGLRPLKDRRGSGLLRVGADTINVVMAHPRDLELVVLILDTLHGCRIGALRRLRDPRHGLRKFLSTAYELVWALVSGIISLAVLVIFIGYLLSIKFGWN